MNYIENSEGIAGYKVKIWEREAFRVTGYTILVPPGRPGMNKPRELWDAIIADGRLEKLRSASSVRPWVLGLGSWDPECEKKGFRYTICIEETEHTDFTQLAREYSLFTKEIGASDWMCFEMSQGKYDERFWKDNPYKMMGPLGYRFHDKEGDFSVGLHFDAYPPDFGHGGNANPEHSLMEFWISVIKAQE